MTHAAILTNDALAILNSTRSLPLLAVVSIKFSVCLTKWATRRRKRLSLQHLEAWQLQDVGLTPEAAHREARSVLWKA